MKSCLRQPKIALQKVLPCSNRNLNLDIKIQNVERDFKKFQAKAKRKNIATWLQTRFHLEIEPTKSDIYTSYKRVLERYSNTVRNKSCREKFQNSTFPFPKTGVLSHEHNDSSNSEAVKDNPVDEGIHQKEIFQIHECLSSFRENIQTVAGISIEKKQAKIDQLPAELEKMKTKCAKLDKKLKEKNKALAHYFPWNVTKREKRKEDRIVKLSKENRELKDCTETLKEKLMVISKKFDKEKMLLLSIRMLD